jgi:hypothetical protein
MMLKMIKTAFLFCVTVGALSLYAADSGSTFSSKSIVVSSAADSSTYSSSTRDDKKNLSKVKGVVPTSKTNWSKIKDLFM